jgi:esterase/lipase superfamily enzyme
MPLPNLYEGTEEEVFANVPEALQTPSINVLFATDRFPQTDRSRDPISFGSERSSHLQVGTVRITVDGANTWEELKAASIKDNKYTRPKLAVAEPDVLFRYPGNFWRAARIDDPSADYDEFMRRRMETRAKLHSLVGQRLAQTPRKEVYVFIHGYNNSFSQAVGTLANLWHFMGREGVPIAYSWPAGIGGLTGYTSDSESGEFTIFHLKMFLEDLAADPAIEKINVLAHSRGTDVIIDAVRELTIAARAAGENPSETLKLGTIILAAPDIDMEVANQRISSERLPEIPDRLTVYLSPKDKALRLSNWLHNGIARLGVLNTDEFSPEQFQALLYFKNLEMVDSRVKTDFLGHGYFYHNPSSSSDLILTLRDKRAAGAANGRPLKEIAPRVWRLEEGYPEFKTAP